MPRERYSEVICTVVTPMSPRQVQVTKLRRRRRCGREPFQAKPSSSREPAVST